MSFENSPKTPNSKESFNGYRDNLAKKISEASKEDREDILETAQQTDEYQQARNEKIQKNQEEESIDDGLGVLLKRKTLYHGSPIGGIDTFTPAEEDTVGKGVYFTSQAKDAIGYARHRSKVREAVPKLYESHVEDLKLLDLRNDENIAKVMPGFADKLREKLKEYQSQGTVSSGVWVTILQEVIQKIEEGKITLSALKQATQQTGHWFSEYVTSLGYAGIATEEGGEGGIGNHDTYLVFDPEHITIRREQDIGKSMEKPPLRTPEEYENLLDPEHTLPKIQIEELPNKMRGSLIPTEFKIRDEQGNEIGELTLLTSRPKNKEATASIAGIRVDVTHLGKGFGRSTYVQLVKRLVAEQVRLQTGVQLSRGSKPIWDWMVERGVARQTSEGQINEETENAAYSSAEYEII
jgi:hypothetical protein